MKLQEEGFAKSVSKEGSAGQCVRGVSLDAWSRGMSMRV